MLFFSGDKTGNSFWKIVRNFLHSPSKEQQDCHWPKPILLDTGEASMATDASNYSNILIFI